MRMRCAMAAGCDRRGCKTEVYGDCERGALMEDKVRRGRGCWWRAAWRVGAGCVCECSCHACFGKLDDLRRGDIGRRFDQWMRQQLRDGPSRGRLLRAATRNEIDEQR